MSFTEWRDGYVEEPVPGTKAIIDADTICYLPGLINRESRHPSDIRPLVKSAPNYDSRELASVDDMWKGFSDMKGLWGVRAQNAIPIWMAMGKSVTVDDSPEAGYYTHTITPELSVPSFTLLHERTGAGSDWATHFVGCKLDSLTLHMDLKELPYLMYRMDWFATSKERVAYVLNNTPELPATANGATFKQISRTFDTTNIKGLQIAEIVIQNGLFSEFVHAWDTGTDTYEGGIEDVHESSLINYIVNLTFHPNVIEWKFWDEQKSDDTPKDAEFIFIRDATYDYIKLTMTGCQVFDSPLITPDPQARTLLDTVSFAPTKLSIEVVDQIPGGAYGE